MQSTLCSNVNCNRLNNVVNGFYGLHKESGLTPMQPIETATIVPVRVNEDEGHYRLRECR